MSMATQLRHGRARSAQGSLPSLVCVDPGQCLPKLGAEAKTYILSGEEGKRGEAPALGSARLSLHCLRRWWELWLGASLIALFPHWAARPVGCPFLPGFQGSFWNSLLHSHIISVFRKLVPFSTLACRVEEGRFRARQQSAGTVEPGITSRLDPRLSHEYADTCVSVSTVHAHTQTPISI